MKQLENCVKLSCQVKIYVPTTINVDIPFDNSEWVSKTVDFLGEKFGGATTTEAFGAWVASNGKLVKEKVDLCYSFASQELLSEYISNVYDFCLNMRIELRQERVGLEINGSLYWV